MKIVTLVMFVAVSLASVADSEDGPRLGLGGWSSATEQPVQGQASVDFDYAWDEFNHQGRMIWECRGVQSGSFVVPEFCAFKEKVDARWPSKNTPGHWKP